MNFYIYFTATPSIYVANIERRMVNIKSKLCRENIVSEFRDVLSLLLSLCQDLIIEISLL
jgi:hypothetical protein